MQVHIYVGAGERKINRCSVKGLLTQVFEGRVLILTHLENIKHLWHQLPQKRFHQKFYF